MTRIYTIPVTFGGPTNEGSPYYKFKKDIKEGCKNLTPISRRDISLKIKLYIHTERVKQGKNDLDNFIKPIIDALDEINIFNENQINSINIERVRVDNKEEEGVEIYINSTNDNQSKK